MSYPFPLKSAQIVSAVDFKLKLYNPDAVNLLRCKRSVVVGASLRNDISCMSNIGFYDRFASVMSSRKDIEFEQRVDHNGEVRWLRVVAKRCQDGIVATMEDISSQKHTESELTQEAKNFQALMESAPDGLSIVEVETGNFMENNAETCRKLGYDRNTMSYLSVYDIDPHAASHREETKAMWRKIVSKALDGAANLIVITDPNANILYVNPAFWATIPVS
jgi:PAS domain-containing protein